MPSGVIALIVIAFFVLVVLGKMVRIVPQARAGVVERLGRYDRTMDAGLRILVPFVDRVRHMADLREQVVSFPPQPVITEDNLVVSIDTVIYYQVTDAKAVTYEIADYIQGIEQLTVTTLRNVIGGMSLEHALTSRDQINSQLRLVLDEATGKWGIRVNRVELKSIDPPGSIQEAMEKQMRAERDRRATILTAEGIKQSQILTAEGEKQAAILKAEGAREAQILSSQAERQSQILEAEGQAKAIETVFGAIHAGNPRRAAARLPVPADAPADRRRGVQQAVDHPERIHPSARKGRRLRDRCAWGSHPTCRAGPAGGGRRERDRGPLSRSSTLPDEGSRAPSRKESRIQAQVRRNPRSSRSGGHTGRLRTAVLDLRNAARSQP